MDWVLFLPLVELLILVGFRVSSGLVIFSFFWQKIGNIYQIIFFCFTLVLKKVSGVAQKGLGLGQILGELGFVLTHPYNVQILLIGCSTLLRRERDAELYPQTL